MTKEGWIETFNLQDDCGLQRFMYHVAKYYEYITSLEATNETHYCLKDIQSELYKGKFTIITNPAMVNDTINIYHMCENKPVVDGFRGGKIPFNLDSEPVQLQSIIPCKVDLSERFFSHEALLHEDKPSNWDKLKQWLQEQKEDRKYANDFERYTAYDAVLKKMEKLEGNSE